jgi:GNAT superfamily N-acetyltransferase
MHQLRPRYSEEELVVKVLRQMKEGYRLAALSDGAGNVVAAAGFRLGENLAWGRYLYVDDLVTDEAARSRGNGQELMDWLVEEARRSTCDELHLDSGVQRFGGHRFYLRYGMDITSHHFQMKIRQMKIRP